MNKYNNHDGLNKSNCRTLMIDSIRNSTTKKNKILSLPAEYFEIEKTLWDKVSKKFNYVLVERDLETYKRLNRNINKSVKQGRCFTNKLPITYNGNIGDIIFDSYPNEYSHIILDYCGQYPTFYKEISHIFKNDIVEKGGTISMTFNKRISGKYNMNFINKIDKLYTYQIPDFDEFTKTMRTLELFLLKECGYKYNIETIFEYYDKNSMVLVIVRRIK